MNRLCEYGGCVRSVPCASAKTHTHHRIEHSKASATRLREDIETQSSNRAQQGQRNSFQIRQPPVSFRQSTAKPAQQPSRHKQESQPFHSNRAQQSQRNYPRSRCRSSQSTARPAQLCRVWNGIQRIVESMRQRIFRRLAGMYVVCGIECIASC